MLEEQDTEKTSRRRGRRSTDGSPQYRSVNWIGVNARLLVQKSRQMRTNERVLIVQCQKDKTLRRGRAKHGGRKERLLESAEKGEIRIDANA